MTRLNLDRIRAAPNRISKEFLRSPQYECEALGQAFGCKLCLKVETINPIRCFKGRGTELALATIQQCDPHATVVCASAGNLGQALAYSARSRGVPAVVIASKQANPLKLNQIRSFGADVQLVDGDIEHARKTAKKMAQRPGVVLIEDSENLQTCEGAATIGLELFEDDDSFDVVLIALGGGALATGVGFVAKQTSPQTRITCVQPQGAPAMTLSWRAQKVIETDSCNTIADGVAGRCPIPEVLDDLLEVADDAVLVKEESIIQGIRLIQKHAGLMVEPSAALGIAALLENPDQFSGKKVATIICGANVHPDDYRRWTAPLDS